MNHLIRSSLSFSSSTSSIFDRSEPWLILFLVSKKQFEIEPGRGGAPYFCERVGKRVFELGFDFDGQLVLDRFDTVCQIHNLLEMHVGPKLVYHVVDAFEHDRRLFVLGLFDELSRKITQGLDQCRGLLRTQALL
jgi:hypothetical protein